jgi:hypothetical protein
VGIRTNFIDDLYPLIHFELKDSSIVLEQYKIPARDIVNLCGGIPSPRVTNIRVIISATYTSALTNWRGMAIIFGQISVLKIQTSMNIRNGLPQWEEKSLLSAN